MAGCDGCTACCKVMHVRELEKPAHKWCPHCRIGSGCGAYETRPESCRVFECIWLQTQRGQKPLALELRPNISHVVLTTTKDDGGEGVVLNLSPDRPNAWKSGAMGALVEDMLRDGIRVVLKCGDRITELSSAPPRTRAS
jgi:uncharacterized protein